MRKVEGRKLLKHNLFAIYRDRDRDRESNTSFIVSSEVWESLSLMAASGYVSLLWIFFFISNGFCFFHEKIVAFL